MALKYSDYSFENNQQGFVLPEEQRKEVRMRKGRLSIMASMLLELCLPG